MGAPRHRKQLQRSVPPLALSRQHEEHQERYERNLQKNGVQRPCPAQNHRSQQARFDLPPLGRGIGSGRGASFDAVDFSFHRVCRATQHASIFRPVLGKVCHSGPQAVSHRSQHHDQNQGRRPGIVAAAPTQREQEGHDRGRPVRSSRSTAGSRKYASKMDNNKVITTPCA